MLENFFKLSENGTTVRTEIIAGLTTFLTLAYIMFVNPMILSDAGMDPGAAELLQEWDLAPTGLLQFQDWTEAGLHALMLVRPLVVVGCADGSGALHWLATRVRHQPL